MPVVSRKCRSILVLIGILLLPSANLLRAQRIEDILTQKQTDDLRDAAQEPNVRLGLYLKYIQERVTALRQLSEHPLGPSRAAQLHGLYRQFTDLSDELDDNLAGYDQQNADMRKGLEAILKESAKWSDVLKKPPGSQAYDFMRATALDSIQSVRQDAAQMLQKQNAYFAQQKKHKDD